jgi:hypothetical protein
VNCKKDDKYKQNVYLGEKIPGKLLIFNVWKCGIFVSRRIVLQYVIKSIGMLKKSYKLPCFSETLH